MTNKQRINAYRRQAGIVMWDVPYALTPKQRRRVKHKNHKINA